jgi:hypothetical protein
MKASVLDNNPELYSKCGFCQDKLVRVIPDDGDTSNVLYLYCLKCGTRWIDDE